MACRMPEQHSRTYGLRVPKKQYGGTLREKIRKMKCFSEQYLLTSRGSHLYHCWFLCAARFCLHWTALRERHGERIQSMGGAISAFASGTGRYQSSVARDVAERRK